MYKYHIFIIPTKNNILAWLKVGEKTKKKPHTEHTTTKQPKENKNKSKEKVS